MSHLFKITKDQNLKIKILKSSFLRRILIGIVLIGGIFFSDAQASEVYKTNIVHESLSRLLNFNQILKTGELFVRLKAEIYSSENYKDKENYKYKI